MVAILALIVFAMFVLVGYGLSTIVSARNDERQALTTRLTTMAGGTQRSVSADPLLKDTRLSQIPALDAMLGGLPIVRRFVVLVNQAGLRRRVGEILLYIVLLFFITLFLSVLLGLGAFLGLITAFVVALVPLMVVARIRQKRTARFAEQLPEALDLVRSALQAGHGLLSAIAVVGETFADPIGQEFRVLVDEVRLGLPMRDALQNICTRVPDENLPILVVGILTAQEVGGNLAEVVDNIAHTIREREKLQRDVRALTAQGRFSGSVLTALPLLVALLMCVFNPKYFAPMLETRTGHYMIAYSLVSILLGHFVIRRIVKVQV